ncbi:hypothetical protein C8J48_3772 [Desmospora activa DSM 45169]|uniref:Uncharacterized protein n=1 Tax=Desmospora activa DSM 45169 TaxID=1121389 RepID=A0A2T4YY81_9BACL|nr:hypothetical protein C8J48_3772 [Desmospora activa DSM 45169]
MVTGFEAENGRGVLVYLLVHLFVHLPVHLFVTAARRVSSEGAKKNCRSGIYMERHHLVA